MSPRRQTRVRPTTEKQMVARSRPRGQEESPYSEGLSWELNLAGKYVTDVTEGLVGVRGWTCSQSRMLAVGDSSSSFISAPSCLYYILVLQ